MINKIEYPIIVFFSSFIIMTVEILGARILAPYLGGSIYVWTSIIGVILLGISVGNFTGGYWADKIQNYKKVLGFIFSISGLLLLAIPFFLKILPSFIASEFSFLSIVIFSSFLLFFLPSIFLGLIFPISVKAVAKNPLLLGKEVGLLSALSALGAILGAFLTGFLFINYLGSSKTLYLASFSLFLLSFFNFSKKSRVVIFILFGLNLSLLFKNLPVENENVIFQKESLYSTIKIVKTGEDKFLFTDSILQGGDYKNPEKQFKIIKSYGKAKLFQSDPKKILFLGGGAYSGPKYLSEIFPETQIDVVELDPDIVKAAQNFFNIKNYPIKNHIADARYFLTTSKEKYDIIVLDVFKNSFSPPWWTTTKEFAKKIEDNLTENGILIVNVAGAEKGPLSKFFQSYYSTLNKIFPQVGFLPLGYNPEKLQNIAFFAFKKQTNFANLLKSFSNDIGGQILTDDFAPVEKIFSSVIFKEKDSNDLKN